MNNSETAVNFKNLGNQAFKQKKYEEAIEYFTQAIKLNPKDYIFYSNRSASYINVHNYELALDDAENCIKLNSQWPKGYQRKGTALYFMQKYNEAIESYKYGIKLDPNNQQLKQDLKAAQSKKMQQEKPPPNQDYLQGLMRLMTNPQTKDYIRDQKLMQKLQMIMQNPSLIPAMMHQDPRLKKAFQIISAKQQQNDAFESFLKNTKTQNSNKSQQQQVIQNTRQQEKVSQNINPAQILKNKGNQEFKRKNFQKSIELYQQAIIMKPDEPLYYNNKAAAYIEMNNYQQALIQIGNAEKLFEQGIVNDYVKKAKVYARKASIFSKQQQYNDSIFFYEKSLVEDSNPKVKDQLLKVKKLKKEKEARQYINPEIAQSNCQAGNILFKQGKFPQALKEYEQAIKRNPDVAKYYSNLGTVYIKLMEFSKARDYFDLAIIKDPKFVKAYPKKGDCHFFLKQYHKALDAYERGLKIQPQNQLCKIGVEKTKTAIYQSNTQEDQQERAKRAMADPEIQKILQTPQITNALNEMQRNPNAIQNIFKNPDLAAKIQRLIEAGVLGMK